MGKYTSVLRGLPQYAGEDASIKEQVNAKRIEIGVLTPGEAAAGYRKARDKKDALEGQVSEINIEVTAYEAILHEVYELAGITSLKLSDGATVGTYVEPYSSVEDAEAYRVWCLEQDLGNRMTLPWATTNSLTKERILEGEPPPPGVKVYVKTKTRLSR
jgi:hypothetical protein